MQQFNGDTTRTTAAAMVLSSAMIVAENDPAAKNCSIHVQQAQVGGPGGWHAQYLALLCLAVGEYELNQRIETGKVDLAAAVDILTGLGHRAAKYSTVKKAVRESLKGGWDSSAEAHLRRSADRKKARSDPPARDKIKLCPEVAHPRDSVNGSHKKCSLCSHLERLYAEATTPVERTDIKLLQRVHASRLKRDRVGEKLDWTCPLIDRSVYHICMDAANKQLAGVPNSHRRRNSTKYNSSPFGCSPHWFPLQLSLLGVMRSHQDDEQPIIPRVLSCCCILRTTNNGVPHWCLTVPSWGCPIVTPICRRYNSFVLGHQNFWTIFVADVVTNSKTGTVIFLLAPWLAKGANVVLEVRHRLRTWMSANGYTTTAAVTVIRQSDGGTDMWCNAAVAMSAVEVADPASVTRQVTLTRLTAGHSHNQTDASIQLVGRALDGTRHQATGLFVLTVTQLEDALMKIRMPGREVAVQRVLNTHDWLPTLDGICNDTVGIMDVHKLRLNLTERLGEVAVTTYKYMGDDPLNVKMTKGEDGCHLQSAVLKPADPDPPTGEATQTATATTPSLPTSWTPYDPALLQAAHDGCDLAEQILDDPQGFGLSPPRTWTGTLDEYLDHVRAQIGIERGWIPAAPNSAAPEPGVAAVVEKLWPAATGPAPGPRAHQLGLAADLAPVEPGADKMYTIGGKRHADLPGTLEKPYDHGDLAGRACFVLYEPATDVGADDRSDSDDEAVGIATKVWVVCVGEVDDATENGPEDQVLRQFDWFTPPDGKTGRCNLVTRDKGNVYLAQPELTITHANVPIYASQIEGVSRRRQKGINLTVPSMIQFRRLQQIHGEHTPDAECAGRLVVPDTQGTPPAAPAGYRAVATATTMSDGDDGVETDGELDVESAITEGPPAAAPSISVAQVFSEPTVTVKNIGQGLCWYVATAPTGAAGTLVGLQRHLNQLARAAVTWPGPVLSGNVSAAGAANATLHLRKILAVQPKLAELVREYVLGCTDPSFWGGGLDQGNFADVTTAQGWDSARISQYHADLSVGHSSWGGEPLERLVPLALHGSDPAARLVVIETNDQGLVRYVRFVTGTESPLGNKPHRGDTCRPVRPLRWSCAAGERHGGDDAGGV